jgi:hypothetical protein
MSAKPQPWKQRREIPDLQVLDAAEQYDDARQLLHRQPPGSGVMLPELNTAAVAVELFLKSLSSRLVHIPVDGFDGLSRVRAEPEFKHHKLVELFDNISDDIRSQLESRFATSNIAPVGTSLRDILGTYEHLFATSRYPFEKDADICKYPLGPLKELSAFLRTFVTNMKPVDRIEW